MGSMGVAMPGEEPVESVPYLKVYKDGKLVDNVCLQGRDRWIFGRHADCDIWVGHASTSRRHLEIQVLHASKELLLVDLQSAHGTRVNGEALKSLGPYIVKHGDTVQMGASTRSYKVDWVVSTIEQVSEAAASVLERSSPNGSKASFRYKLGNIQGAKEEIGQQGNLKEKSSKGINRKDNVPSPALRDQGQRGGRPELPPRTPVRRLPLANVQASALNMRSPQRSALRKAVTTLPKKVTSSKTIAVMEDTRLTEATEVHADGPDKTSSNLWLRRCSSAPMPRLITAAVDSGAQKENKVEVLPVLIHRDYSCSGEVGRSESSLENASLCACDGYPSHKENYQAKNNGRSPSCDGRQQSWRSSKVEEEEDSRQPFAESLADLKLAKPVFSPSLVSSPDSDFGSRTLRLPPPQRPATSAMVNNLNSLFGKLKLGGELHRCQWHAVVDTNCLLDRDALKSLKQLEGIRETRIIIPKIVLRELDGLKRRHDIGSDARVALKWIEDCMERIPFWMHVQRSTEIPPIQRTPSSSPSRMRKFSVQRDQGLMTPTNDDHILDCALLFDRSVMGGCVVLLTRDTALKIKAMAEGVTVNEATSFCESLLSPYSERFLWLGSTACISPVNGLSNSSRRNQPYTGYQESYAVSPLPMPNLEVRISKKSLSPKAKGHGKHGVEAFRCHYSERPEGLQVLLA